MFPLPSRADAPWVQDLLVSHGVVPPAASLDSVESVPLTAGRMAGCVRWRLRWRDPAERLPGDLVAKFPATGVRSRTTGAAGGLYEHEVRFYREIAAVEWARAATGAPRCHLAVCRADGDFLVLLDYLPGPDATEDLPVSQAERAVRRAAHMHAEFRDGGGRRRPDWLTGHLADGGRRAAAVYRLALPRFLDRFGDRVDPATRTLAQRFGDRIGDWLASSGPPHTLVHGDFRSENLRFGDDRGEPAVVDWQTVGSGPGAADVAYLLGGSLDPRTRRRCTDELLAEYHDALRRLGAPVDRAAAWHAHRVGALSGLHMAVTAALLVDPEPDEEEMLCGMARRHAAHCDDVDALGALR